MGHYLCAPQKQRPEIKTLKFLFIGESGAGKTSLISQLCYGTFSKSLPRTQCHETHIFQLNDLLRISFLDTSGSDRLKSCLTPSLVKRMDAIIYVYDQSKPKQLEKLSEWQNYIKLLLSEGSRSKMPRSYLIANKSDLCLQKDQVERTLSEVQYLNFSLSFSVSSCMGFNLGTVINQIVEDMNKPLSIEQGMYEFVVLDQLSKNTTVSDEDLRKFVNS